MVPFSLGLVALASVALTGCGSIGYVAHVSAGQLRIFLDRERLTPERIEALSEAERRGLGYIAQARELAAEIGLEPSTSYRHVIDRDRDSAVRVVVASPRDALEAVTWWFPIVGRIAYRGYFDPARADAFARELAAEGYDTYVRPALLYSTLGYFDDPIPLAVLRWSEADLTDVIVHELVHGTIFVADDAAYNEGLASFVAEEATLLHLADRPDERARAAAAYADQHRYEALIDELARALEALYADPAIDDPVTAREAVFERFQKEVYPTKGWSSDRYAGFQQIELSNAFVVAQRTYSGDLPCFRAELRELGGDLRAFIRAHREAPGHRADCGESGA